MAIPAAVLALSAGIPELANRGTKIGSWEGPIVVFKEDSPLLLPPPIIIGIKSPAGKVRALSEVIIIYWATSF
jgi:hypothetical protein